ncbi:hypothetical protein K439DRAFT_1621662 [Ramaria rubella]|nr:hypothetical protein K439DRAFT_1621662 [Ramaria rubella]
MDNDASIHDNSGDVIQYRRKSQVFVEIPPSPFFRTRVAFTSSKVDDPLISHISEGQKENAAPLSTKICLNNIPADKKSKGKRKAPDEDGMTQGEFKKVKIQNSNGTFVACHQCRSKKSASATLQCTRISKKTGNRCKASYCDACLRNRYGKELKTIRQSDPSKFQDGYITCTRILSPYRLPPSCPRCDGNCNCAPCRKKQGLAPVGKFTFVLGGESVREILEKNPQASGLLPKQTVISTSQQLQGGLPPNPAANTTTGVSKEKGNTTGVTRIKGPKKVPEPIWVPVPLTLTKEEVEDRIYVLSCQLREFILRFNPILNIGVRNLEELDDFTSLHDSSTKAILLALLEIVAVEDATEKKNIQAKMKAIRGLGLNWGKIVPILHTLRDSMPEGHALRTLPGIDGTDVEASYNTRGGRIQGLSANQLLPILLYLIGVALGGASVRQELEEGNQQAKDARATYYKTLREETERWATEKAKLGESKPASENKGEIKDLLNAWKFRKAESEHKAIVSNIQNSYKPEMDCSASRFASLGCDTDGRTYYALSASGPQRGKKERLPSEGERSSLKRWGWFVAVFGKAGTVVGRKTEDVTEDEGDCEENKDPNAERWWGFEDVGQMRSLSKWLAYCAEVNFPGSIGKDANSSSSGSGTATSTLISSLSHNTGGVLSDNCSVSPTSDLFLNEMDVDRDEQDLHESDMSQPATALGMKSLAKAVLDFAEFVDWRLKRESGGTRKQDSATGDESIL